MKLAGVSLCMIAAVSGGNPMDAVLADRRETLAAFRDPRVSPLAAVARHDFQGDKPLSIGGGSADDVRLDGLPEKAAVVRALPDGFEMVRGGKTERLPPGVRVELGRYTLRLSHQNFPGLIVLDPQNPRLSKGPFPVWFDPAPAYRVEARLVRDPQPKEVVILSTRGNKRRALRVGHLEFALDGKTLRLTATRLLEPGVKDTDLSLFFRDATTGRDTYSVGRYVEPEHVAGDRFTIDFNRAYNPTCAFSPLYNCPIPPRENVLPVAVRAGERDPGH